MDSFRPISPGHAGLIPVPAFPFSRGYQWGGIKFEFFSEASPLPGFTRRRRAAITGPKEFLCSPRVDERLYVAVANAIAELKLDHLPQDERTGLRYMLEFLEKSERDPQKFRYHAHICMGPTRSSRIISWNLYHSIPPGVPEHVDRFYIELYADLKPRIGLDELGFGCPRYQCKVVHAANELCYLEDLIDPPPHPTYYPTSRKHITTRLKLQQDFSRANRNGYRKGYGRRGRRPSIK